MFVCYMPQLIPAKCRVVESWVTEDGVSTHTHTLVKPCKSCGFNRTWLRMIANVFFSRCPLKAQTFKFKNVVDSAPLTFSAFRQMNNLSFLWRHDQRKATRERAGTQTNQSKKNAPTVCGCLLAKSQCGFRARASTIWVHSPNLPRRIQRLKKLYTQTELFITNTQGLNMSKLLLIQLHPCYWMDCHEVNNVDFLMRSALSLSNNTVFVCDQNNLQKI